MTLDEVIIGVVSLPQDLREWRLALSSYRERVRIHRRRIPHLDKEVVDLGGGDAVKPAAWFINHKDFWFQDQRPRQAGSFLHSA